MSIWDWLRGGIGSQSDCSPDTGPTFNPATGLPMIGDGIGGIDVGGSPFGMDVHQHLPEQGHQIWDSCVGSDDWLTGA